jgi:uncharacterized membrane protein
MSWRAWSRTSYEPVPKPDQNLDLAQTPQASLFGIPNAALAVAYFGTVALLSLTGAIDRRPARRLALGASWISLLVSGYLTYSLVFILRKNCSSCIQTHALNLALTLVITTHGGGMSARLRRK